MSSDIDRKIDELYEAISELGNKCPADSSDVREVWRDVLALITEARLNEVQRAYESRNNATPEAHAEYFRDRIAELTKQKDEM